ncbi:hypothetical protein GCM10011571_13560 [Marinithermofilum abyssi]|uniref:Uncharacterized protein n=1 Tax=Marinithermofilum abyssi TaxID=1571185 RepID=A0A8J2Y923_9BACL|nr:hypothetical protein GCM10011571_13560 [Marinithermofilum abyssi]
MEAAVAEGHEVTLFNRGNHPDMFPELEQLQGDRENPSLWKVVGPPALSFYHGLFECKPV